VRVEGSWFIPDGAPADAAIVYAHGGSFVIGSVRSYADLLSRLAAATGLRVLGFDYRLAPEHRFPAALDDTVAAAAAAGVPPHRLLLAGDSAGGNLALGAALELTRRRRAPAGLILLSPWVDLTCSRPSVQRNARLDWGDGGYLKHWVSLYLPAGVAADDPRVSPLNADLSGLPPMQLHVGTAELLHDEVVELSERAIWANVGVDLRTWPDMVHGWALLPSVFPAAAQTLRACATFAAERLGLNRSSRPSPLPPPAAAPPPRSR
jgi:epsilon-lactone hydrolase